MDGAGVGVADGVETAEGVMEGVSAGSTADGEGATDVSGPVAVAVGEALLADTLGEAEGEVLAVHAVATSRTAINPAGNRYMWLSDLAMTGHRTAVPLC